MFRFAFFGDSSILRKPSSCAFNGSRFNCCKTRFYFVMTTEEAMSRTFTPHNKNNQDAKGRTTTCPPLLTYAHRLKHLFFLNTSRFLRQLTKKTNCTKKLQNHACPAARPHIKHNFGATCVQPTLDCTNTKQLLFFINGLCIKIPHRNTLQTAPFSAHSRHG
ncbi:hypothetical protein DTO96_100726 [Ephemeroptericola cinctiostellae]|uniref:Uncharacterized protein n=1 Tax=Ephemeroptericola cinctiostellae TaxID=2268024 RepID=A0A345D9H1_9BURK|nr:hypothetical protein DTO96_100726 [Ephemeroptericola cinctiostellae]